MLILCDTKFILFFFFYNFYFIKFIFDWFKFETDWIEMLLLFVKIFLEIKLALAMNENVKWIKLVKLMAFEDMAVIFLDA